jgi:hypothetical protein
VHAMEGSAGSEGSEGSKDIDDDKAVMTKRQ